MINILNELHLFYSILCLCYVITTIDTDACFETCIRNFNASVRGQHKTMNQR